MTALCTKEECVGCGACADICPADCIQMESDAEGFRYPVIDEARCVQCGRCRKVCPVLNGREMSSAGNAYAVHSHNADVVRNSSSGGMFTALAEQTIQNGGVVYGAGFTDAWSVAHRRIDTVDALSHLRGSKYVQSVMGDSYSRVKADLAAGRPVLFSGTPCQVAALRQFLGHDDPKLICVDIICHSVPSPGVWKHYLQTLENQTGHRVIRVNFRDKRESWQQYFLSVTMDDGTEILVRGKENRYMRAFIQGLSTRPSCYSCHFKGENRASDITLGDFWGVESISPDAFQKYGTSLVLVHTEKGQTAFRAVSQDLDVKPADRERALAANPAYSIAAHPHEQRAVFFAELRCTPFDELVDRLLPSSSHELQLQNRNRGIIMRALRKMKRILCRK